MSGHFGHPPPPPGPPPPPPYQGHYGGHFQHYGGPPPPPHPGPPHHHWGGGGHHGHGPHGHGHHGPPHHHGGRHHGPPPPCSCMTPPPRHGGPGQGRRPGRSFREEFHDDGSTRVHRIWIERSIESEAPQPQELELSHPQKVAHELALHISSQIPNPVTVLDVGVDTHDFYASRMLQPRAGSITGLATDPRVASAYNTHATTEQLAKERMHAVHIPAMSDLSQLNGHAFDVVLCAQPIDQRPDIASAIPSLVSLLKPGGRIFFASLDLSLRAVQRGETSEAPAYRNERVEDLCAEGGLTECTTTRVDQYGYLPSEPGVLYIIEATKPGRHVGSSSMHLDTRTVSERAQSPVLV